MVEEIATIRDGNARLEELRSALTSIGKESLIDRKELIKKLAREHRDNGTLENKQLDDSIAEIEEINGKIKEAEKIEDEIRSLESQIKLAQEKVSAENEKNQNRSIEKMENLEKRSTMEYRKAFMDYIQRGVASDVLETRADAYTSTATASTVIPNTVMDEIIKASKISGNILAKVRKMNVKGGVRVPTLSVIPTATWITEDKSSERQALSTGSVQFSYYGLEVKIAQSLLSEYTSIDAFEREFASLAVEAMTNAKEVAIFNGTGVGQPTGILKEAGVKEVALTLAELGKYDKLVSAFGNLAVGYRAGAEFAMASSTWDRIVGMVDSQNQPVARTNYGLNGATMSLFGYPVNLVEADRIKGVDTATAGTDYVIVLGQFNKYGLNSNGEIGVISYIDHDHNQKITKALEFVDGKVLDTNAFIKIKLKSGTSS